MRHVTLDDKYDLEQSSVYLTGAQAIVRLALMQHARDQAAGLRTAGYISGYRGSPLGGLDQQLGRVPALLGAHHIVFQPGINEDLAATAIWGAQQAELRGEGRYDGVFGLWYGKGPGVDRSGDVFRHANHAGTSRHGGVIALMGDDHTCESSTSAHQSEFAFVDAMMPILNPAGVQEILDYGLYGWALSRFSGLWVGIKCVKDNVEQTATVDGAPGRVRIVTPSGFDMPPGGLNIRLGDSPLAKEERLHRFRRPAALAFARANGLDRLVFAGGDTPRVGIITTGKSYLDVAAAFDLLRIDEARAAALGLRLYKVAMVWPLEPEGIARMADGLDLLIVVEEKRSLIETQIKEQLYGRANAPAVIGKRDERGVELFPAHGALEPVRIAAAIGERLLARRPDAELKRRLGEALRARARTSEGHGFPVRTFYFCAGCPHNTSTVIPEGARAYAGIGCHYMVQWMDRATEGFTHMGAEGANWIGEAPFSTREHVFQNIGDGTYVHSGALAIRAAIAAGANMTFKLLYNDAVALTGGQAIDGGLTVPQLARQLVADGAARVALVVDDPGKYGRGAGFPRGVRPQPRHRLDAVQRELATIKGVTVLIYDQTCAAEKRRRRKRGAYPDPDARVFINELVCEGCGDCGVQSNCVALVPVETEFGRKRAIDQSACNKDWSCLKGFCPSFVTVRGGRLRAPERAARLAPDIDRLPEPKMRELDGPRSLLIAGVGGTGVVTLGALLGMAAHLEGKGAGVIDMAGLAQKGGPVTVHARIAPKPRDINAIRASVMGADLLLGCDLVVAASDPVLALVRKGVTQVVVSTHELPTGAFTRAPDLALPTAKMRAALEAQAGARASRFLDSHALAQALLGDSIYANMLLLGVAYQAGGLPVGASAIEEAIRLNGVAVEANTRAFRWGRLAAHDPAAAEKAAAPAMLPSPERRLATTLDEAVARRAHYLTVYQNAAYAERYRAHVETVRRLEAVRVPGAAGLAEAVARGLFRLMAFKDAYEVARLYTDGSFARALEAEFAGDYRLEFHLSPPGLAPTDRATGRPRKVRLGPWAMRVFRMLAPLKALRGTPLDPFGYTRERRMERRLLRDYEEMLNLVARRLAPGTHETAVALARLPEAIRGFGPVKERAAAEADARRADLLAALDAGHPERRHAA